MTISGTPEKNKKRQQRKGKSTKKVLVQEEEEDEDDEETKAYKQRLRNVNYSSEIHLNISNLFFFFIIATKKNLQ